MERGVQQNDSLADGCAQASNDRMGKFLTTPAVRRIARVKHTDRNPPVPPRVCPV